MAWASSLANRVTSATPLPLILAGPLLRKTETEIITVWVALKEARTNIELSVYSGVAPQGSTAPKTLLLYGVGSTIALGEHLHVAAISASTYTNRGPLVPDAMYCYDISFGNGQTLASPGVFSLAGGITSTNGEIGLCYGNSTLPTFALPPSDLNKLHILHSSCRKPHGGTAHEGEKDALALADTIIGQHYADPQLRPHQFYHTGDQIYSDDVAGSLLYMLHDASMYLTGWVEDLPQVPHVPDAIWPKALQPGNRWNTLKELTKFSTGAGYGDNHLMRLGEFYCMYLFAWSDVLWPSEATMPSFQDVYPGAPETVQSFYGVEGQDYVTTEVSPIKAQYTLQKKQILGFQSTLKQVRRALANVPSYMMCDDHEITDDWFISYKWTQDVYGYNWDTNTYRPDYTLGRRIIQNGLSAFNIFQAWGNKPASYQLAGSPENILLTSLATLHAEAGRQATTWQTIHDYTVPVLVADGVNIAPTPKPRQKLSNANMPSYSFSIIFDKFILLALDSRLERSFVTHGKDEPPSHYGPELINTAAMDRQITAHRKTLPSTVEVAMVLCPAPVFGHAFVEGIIQQGSLNVEKSISVGPYRPFSREGEYFENELDREGWSFNTEAMQRLLLELSLFEKVVLYSGDVHYGFSATIAYTNNRAERTTPLPGTTIQYPSKASFIQLVASALKNSTDGVMGTRINGQVKFWSMEDKDFLFAGWNRPGHHINRTILSGMAAGFLPKREIYDKTTLFVAEIGTNQVVFETRNDYADSINDPPQWTYTVRFGLDKRTYLQRIDYPGANLPIYSPGTMNPLLRAAYNLRYNNFNLQQDLAVGLDQIAQVKFKWGATKQVTQYYWFRVNETAGPGPLTIHELVLSTT